MSKRIALLDSEGFVTNVALYPAEFIPNGTTQVLAAQGVRIGDIWDGSAFIDAPTPDYSAIDQDTVDALLLESGVMRALAKALFAVVNDVRVLKGDSPVTASQFKTYLKGLIR